MTPSRLSFHLLVSAQVVILGNEIEPHIGLRAQHGVCLRFSLSCCPQIPAPCVHARSLSFFFLIFFKFLFIYDSQRERGRDIGRGRGRGRSRLHAPGARCGTRSRVSRIAPWAKGRRQTAAPPRDPDIVYFLVIL